MKLEKQNIQVVSYVKILGIHMKRKVTFDLYLDKFY